jgi:integrase
MSALRLWSPDGDDSNPASSVPPLRSAAPTVKAVIDWFIEFNPKPSKSPVADTEQRRIWALFVSKYGRKLVAEMRGFELVEFVAGQVGVRSNWTRKRWNATVQKPFNKAVKLGIIASNPFRGVSFPDGKEGRDWTDEEFRALLRNTSPCFRRVLVAVRFSGMRPGEVREVEWSEVRESLNALVIDASKTKTKLTRRIPFNHVLLKLILWLRRRSPLATGAVFVNSRGEPWTIGAFVSRIDRLREAAGLPSDVRLHGGRHLFATRAILNGLDIAVLAQLLGHKSISTTQRYIHLANKVDHLGAAMEAAIL